MNPERKYKVIVRRRLPAAELEIHSYCDNEAEVKQTIAEVSSLLPKEAGLIEKASFTVTNPLERSVTEIVPELVEPLAGERPVLSKPPYLYSVNDAICEVLDPRTSVWARIPRTVREVQQTLAELSVTGISNIQNFDSAIRFLAKQGKIQRELSNGTYKYFRKVN